MPFNVHSLKWKMKEYRILREMGARRSILRDIISDDYKRDSLKIYNSILMEKAIIAREKALAMGIKFLDNTPGDLLIEIYLEKIYDIPGFIPSKGDKIIDVGASVGDTAIYWAKVHKAHVIAFEPLNDIFEIMKQNVILNDLEDLIEMHNEAIGNGNIIKGNNQNNMFKKSGNSDLSFRSRKLDEFNFDNISFLKIDVEGYEAEVIEGAIETIKSNHPKIILETHSKDLRRRCSDFLESFGYVLYYHDKSRRGEGWMDEVMNLFYL